jgi:predicted oxidoreductase
VELERVTKEILHYDSMIERGPHYFNDEQLRRIVQLRSYRGDRVRTCRYQKILDPEAGPLIAIREFILSRKSLGGIQTNLLSQVIAHDGKVMDGLYAVGEAAGFGGGGIHGKRALEGSFLGSCILTARSAALHIASGRSLSHELEGVSKPS